MMIGGAGMLLAASPAQAADISYKTECIPPAISGLPPVEGTTQVQLTAPAQAKVGDTVEVVWKTVAAASKNPDVLDLSKDTVQPTGTIKLGGAATGDLKMEGPRQNPPIPKNSAMLLSDMKGSLKLEKAGDLTLTPDAYNINVSKPISTDTKCTPKETVKPGATIKVTDGGGTTAAWHDRRRHGCRGYDRRRHRRRGHDRRRHRHRRYGRGRHRHRRYGHRG